MALPKQVKEQGEKADKLLNEQLNPESEADAEAKRLAEEQEEADRKKAEEEAKQKKEAEVKEPSEVEKLQQKLNTLQGKYNAEVNDTKTTNQFLIEKVRKLELEKKELEDAKGQVGGQKLDLSTLLTPEQVERLNDELDPEVQNILTDLFGNMMKTTSASQVEPLKTELDSLKQGQQKTDWEIFLGRVYKAVPNFEAVNIMPKFVEYMAQRVPGTGATRQQLMDNAASRMDTDAVVEIYKDFLDLQPAATDPNQNKRKDLKSQIDPATQLATQSREQLTQASDKIFTVSQVNEHYKQMALGESSNYTRGKYANKKEYAKQVDADILKANEEGRIKR